METENHACLLCQRPVAQNSFGGCCNFSPPITHQTENAEGLRVCCPDCGWWQDEGANYGECERNDCDAEMPSLEKELNHAAWRRST